MAKGIGGKKKLKFRTTANENSARRRLIIGIFSVVVLIIAAVSLFVVINEYDLFGGEGNDENPISDDAVAKLEGSATMLFAGVSSLEDEVHFLATITLDATNRSFIVSAVPPGEQCNGSTLSDIYAESGSADLAEAVEAATGIPIDRYAVVTEKKFKSFMTSLGLPELEIETKLDYTSDEFSLNLLAGTQTLTGDKLYKYIRFVGLGGSDYELQSQGEIIGEIISQKLNETNTEKGEDLFASLINKCESNITIVDFTKYYGLLCEISAEPREVEILSYTAERD